MVALDWKWLFIYPEEGVASVNGPAVPVGVPIHFVITSSGVMNSFFVPRLGSQIYAMAGMATQLWLQADEAGTFNGFSANFSGAGFSGMRFDLKALPADDYAKWIADAKASATDLDRARYAELVKPSMNVSPSAYRSVEPRLFEVDREWVRAAAVGVDPADAPGGDLRGNLMLGKLTWDAIPFNQPIPLVTSIVVIVVILSVLGADYGQGVVALSVARVDHLGRP